MNRLPVSVALVAWLFIAAGLLGIVCHSGELISQAFSLEAVWVLVVRVLAVVGGVLLLRSVSWPRWILVLWIAYHVVLSAMHSVSELVVHLVILAGVAYLLFRPGTSAYFRAASRPGSDS